MKLMNYGKVKNGDKAMAFGKLLIVIENKQNIVQTAKSCAIH